MSHAKTILATIILLLFAACTTTRKVTTEETKLIATSDSSAGHRESSTATLQDQTTWETTDAENISISFERWEYTPTLGALSDSLRVSPGLYTYGREREGEPPDAKLYAYTKGVLNITRGGAKRSTSQTSATATKEVSDTTSAKSDIRQEAKATTSTTSKKRDYIELTVLIVIAAAVYLICKYMIRRW